ncbi:MAG: CHASE2 domain-containing protein, partial [Deltaproteobacteria bacterium]|nr:CHASE2 domain-containing protein [Deltaproteobacteria bacterium]
MKISAPSLRSPLIAGLLVSIFVFLGIIGIRRTGGVESLELSSYDWVIRLHARGSKSDSRIVLVTINEEDIRTLGRWPLSDATVARLLTKLIRHHPRAVGVDLYRDIPMPPGHEELRAVLTTCNNIVMVMKFAEGTSGGIPPPEVLEGTQQVGFNDFVVDPGGIVRRGLLFLDDGETVF